MILEFKTPLCTYVLFRVTIALMKHCGQKQCDGGKCLFVFYIISHCPLREAKVETWTGSEYEGRSWCKGHVERLFVLHCMFSLISCSTQNSSPEMAPTRVDWALKSQSLIKKVSYRSAHSSILWGTFSIDFLSSEL